MCAIFDVNVLLANVLSAFSQGGSSEAGEEKKRQNKLEDNYNLVWGDSSMKKASDADEDDPDTELVFDDTDLF